MGFINNILGLKKNTGPIDVNLYIQISSHISEMIGLFGYHFKGQSLPRKNCLDICAMSLNCHKNLLNTADLKFYDEQILLAKNVYSIMANEINNQNAIYDIVFSGNSDMDWTLSCATLNNLYNLELNEKSILAFFYLHQIYNGHYFNLTLPKRDRLNSY